MKKFNIYILFGMLIFPFSLLAQVDTIPLKIQQIRKYGIDNPILLDSTDFFYNDKNQPIQTKVHQFYGANSNDLKVERGMDR